MKAVATLFLLCAASALAVREENFIGAYVEAPEIYYSALADSFSDSQATTRNDNYKSGLPGGFKCPTLASSPAIPTDARFVRPSDIQVVGAIGDSLTAANGVKAWTIPTVLKQYRGLSWSAGGDETLETVLTMPNVLKKYNSKLSGFSVGSSYSQDTKDAYYNVARAGNTAVDIVGQSEKLVEKITVDKKQSLWKIITLFIGGNDVCDQCKEPVLYSPASYKKNVITAINNLYASLPNTIVNLVAPLDMSEVSLLPEGYGCKAVHKLLCSCLYNESDPSYGTRISQMYQNQIKEIIEEAAERWPLPNFGIAYHPIFTGGEFPKVDGKPDTSYLAPDCFHFSQKGQEAAAFNLWNSMVTPRDQRLTNLETNRTLICPTEDSPFIQL